jgi:ABC-type phosphate transport system substrate-binding protein
MRGLLVIAFAVCATAALARGQDVGYVVVVNASNGVTGVDRKFLADAFLKKTTRWPNGDTIRPVDQTPDAAPRRRFTDDVLRRSVAAVKSYWQQRIFSGRDVPPPELESDAQVVRYVLTYRGAVGYVSPGAAVEGVKTVSVK